MSKTKRNPKFKVGQICFREMGFDSEYSGYVKITGIEISDDGYFWYEIEYIKRDGTKSKVQPSGSAHEHQLIKLKSN